MWKKIKDHPNYLVSVSGEVYSLITKRVLRQSLCNSGHLKVTIGRKVRPKTIMVHRLVAKAFLLNSGDRSQVNHKNGDKLDNHVLNLEWATPSENMKHAFRSLGVKPPNLGRPSKDNPQSRPVVQLQQGRIVKEWDSIADATRAGFNSSHISRCCLGRKDYKTHKGYEWRYRDA